MEKNVPFFRSKNKSLSPVSTLIGHSKSISSAFFSPVSGKSVVTVSYDNKIRLFDVDQKSGEIPARRQLHHINETGRWLTTFKVWLTKFFQSCRKFKNLEASLAAA